MPRESESTRQPSSGPTKQFVLLQHEGHLMEGCFVTAFHLLKSFDSRSTSEKTLFYAAFFNYAAGLERLLKLIHILDFSVQSSGGLPTDKQLKAFGHDLIKLSESAAPLFARYGVSPKEGCQADGIDLKLLRLFSDFARKDRYFNLDELLGTARSNDPLKEWGQLLREAFQADVPETKRVHEADQIDALLASMPAVPIIYRETRLDGTDLAFEAACKEEGEMKLALREVTWRLVKMLVPLKDLLCELCYKLSSNDNIPYLYEFLEFVNPEKKFTVDNHDWPHLFSDG